MAPQPGITAPSIPTRVNASLLTLNLLETLAKLLHDLRDFYIGWDRCRSPTQIAAPTLENSSCLRRVRCAGAFVGKWRLSPLSRPARLHAMKRARVTCSRLRNSPRGKRLSRSMAARGCCLRRSSGGDTPGTDASENDSSDDLSLAGISSGVKYFR